MRVSKSDSHSRCYDPCVARQLGWIDLYKHNLEKLEHDLGGAGGGDDDENVWFPVHYIYVDTDRIKRMHAIQLLQALQRASAIAFMVHGNDSMHDVVYPSGTMATPEEIFGLLLKQLGEIEDYLAARRRALDARHERDIVPTVVIVEKPPPLPPNEQLKNKDTNDDVSSVQVEAEEENEEEDDGGGCIIV